MNKVIFAWLFVLFFACASDVGAQTETLSTRDVASCRADSDLAICLLGVEARWQSLRNNPAFARAPEVLAQLDRFVPRSPDSGDRLDRAYYAAAIGPLEASSKAVSAVLEADQRGVQPSAALQPLTTFGRDIQSQSFIFGQIITASGVELRIVGYSQIWNAYAESIGKSRFPRVHAVAPPSRGLALAALAAWEQDIVAALSRPSTLRSDYGFSSPVGMADALAVVGDFDAAKRLDKFERGLEQTVRLDVLMSNDRLDEAAAIATTHIRASTKVEQRLWEQSWKLIEAAQRAKRGDLAVSIARHVLKTTRRPHLDTLRAALVIASNAPTSDVIAMAEDFDQQARSTRNRNASTNRAAALAGVAAVATWTALGQTDRSNALIEFWRPRGLSAPSNYVCGDDFTGCDNATVVEMLRRANRLTEGFDGLGLTAQTAILADLNDGRGLARLDLFLLQEKTPQRRELALSYCVEWAISNGDLTIATLCAERLQASAASRGLSADEAEQLARYGAPMAFIGGVYVAAERCLDVAAAAALRNEMTRARNMLGCALDLWAGAPSARWDYLYTSKATQVGIALLKEQGRL
jgi:hypothetical protein